MKGLEKLSGDMTGLWAKAAMVVAASTSVAVMGAATCFWGILSAGSEGRYAIMMVVASDLQRYMITLKITEI